MFGGQMLLDPDLRPRRGQRVTLHYLGREIQGRVSAVSGIGVEIQPESLSLLRHLRPDACLRGVIVGRSTVTEVVLTQVHVNDDVLSGQLAGHPVSIQRRAAERIAVPLDATLSWLDARTGKPVQRQGRTENLCVAGALVHFSDARRTLPAQDTVALLGLELPGQAQPLAVSVRVLQAWQDGVRLQVVDAVPAAADRLREFVDAHLPAARRNRR